MITRKLVGMVAILIAGGVSTQAAEKQDGATLWLRNRIIVRLELSDAHEYKTKLKAEKEQKARESVPQF